MRIILAFPVVLFFGAISLAQKVKCDLTIDKAPELRSVRAGMTAEQIFLVAEGDKIVQFRDWIKNKKLGKEELEKASERARRSVDAGESQFQYAVKADDRQDPKAPLHRVERIFLSFFNNHAYSISISYDIRDISYANSKEFALAMSGKLNLPPNGWDFTHSYDPVMECRDFTVRARSSLGIVGTISLLDTKQLLENDSAAASAWIKAQEKQKANFKP
jgi:hypothetical protein